jgi:hypothetical protein
VIGANGHPSKCQSPATIDSTTACLRAVPLSVGYPSGERQNIRPLRSNLALNYLDVPDAR